MSNFSKTSLSPVEDGPHIYNNTSPSNSFSNGPDQDSDGLGFAIVFTPFICTIGLVGNGIVIRLLGFHIKRNPFTTYILNLAVADFGVLLCFGLIFASLLTGAQTFFFFLYAAILTYNTSQLLLTAISLDRCASVLFPIWHRCHRPPHLSTIMCTLIWVLSCLFTGGLAILSILESLEGDIFVCLLMAVAILCVSLVTLSTTILLFKVFCRSQQPRRGRLLTLVFLTLLFFLIFAFPLNIILTLNYFTSLKYLWLIEYGLICTNLNSCVNPVIYYLVGRKKRGPQRQSLKLILQRAFKEEVEGRREDRGTAAQTSL